MPWLLAIYLVGVAVGLLRVDGPVVAKVVVALLWPLGLVAFAVTVATLLIVAGIAFPIFGLALAAALATVWALLA